MKNRFLAVVFSMLLWPALSEAGPSQNAPVYFLAGQVHPQYEITLSINSQVIKTVTPKPDTMKVFLKQFDADQVQSGSNQLKVTYKKHPGGGNAGGPSFKVKLKYQTDPTDKKSAKVLAKISGPRKPFTDLPDSGELIEEFEASR